MNACNPQHASAAKLILIGSRLQEIETGCFIAGRIGITGRDIWCHKRENFVRVYELNDATSGKLSFDCLSAKVSFDATSSTLMP